MANNMEVFQKLGVSEDVLEQARQRQTEHGGSLREQLIALGELTQEVFEQRVSQLLRVPYVHLEEDSIPDNVLRLLPRDSAERYRALPIELDEKHRRLKIAMADPADMSTIDELKFIVGHTLIPCYMPEDEIQEQIRRVYARLRDRQAVKAAWTSQAPLPESQRQIIELSALTGAESPLIKRVGQLFSLACAQQAREIRLATTIDGGRIDLKRDGRKSVSVQLPRHVFQAFLPRVKRILGEVGERFTKGSARLAFQENTEFDVAYVIAPTGDGEEILLKLREAQCIPKLEELYLAPEPCKALEQVCRRSHGAVLVTGTARSGVTTTLYTLVNHVTGACRDVCSIENPVECRLDGVSQGQIDPEKGQTYSQYLNALRTQHPHVLMVDHLFEPKTARAALSLASETFVLGSMTAIDTASAAMKLLLMTSPQSLVDHVNALVSQRLVRKICEGCKEPVELADHVREKLGLSPDDICYAGKGCDLCGQTGFHGVLPVVEVLLFSDDIRDVAFHMQHARELRQAMADAGMPSLRDDGMRKVIQGLTTVQEVLRATIL